jgi:hypothetical protein
LVLVEDRPTLSLSPAVLSRVAATCDRGGSVIWLARGRAIGHAAAFPTDHHLRLSDHGLALIRPAG